MYQTDQTENNLSKIVGAELSNLTGAPAESFHNLQPAQNLLEYVDSFGFANLLMQIEQRLGAVLDLTSVDIGELTQLGTLMAFLDEQLLCAQELQS